MESVSYALKKKHPNIKRNVKFDDERMDLVLDFCVDPSDPSCSWKKLRPEQANIVKKKIAGQQGSDEMTEDEIGRLLEV